jgi:LuxR family maltose regulon positive regulatory protein
MKVRLLATKFHIPPWRAASVPRPRLLEQLSAGLRECRKLTLISAPAGYGKTTLITEWLHSLIGGEQQIAWLSLDDADNDPGRFLSYLLAAFPRTDKAAGEKIDPMLDLPQLPPVNTLMDEFINDLIAIGEPILLTLEDYHVISNPVIHEALTYFISHQPASVHLVIITRQDPPLPLPRLRARAEITEIRARDLRFTPEEVRQFFIRTMKLELAKEAANMLEERTEGWAVGLQLAGLALQNMTNPQRFIETFRGSHRYVLDYLAEEVIRQQGEEMRAFLTHTSVPDRFNAGVCSALTGRLDSRAVIEQLEQANLFVVPLDDERIWYRYHHLFSDYLRTLLTRPEKAALYRKAAAWYEANDLPAEAVQYALASEDHDFSADVIERAINKNTTWSGGNIRLLSAWLDALPPQTLQDRPRLSLHASRILYLSGRYDLAEKRLAQTEDALKSEPAAPETGQMLALAALYRGSIASVRGEVQQAVERITFAQSRIPKENHLAHARAFYSLGLASEIDGQTERAVENYLLSSDEAALSGVLFLAVNARCAAAQLQIRQGRLNLAVQTCQEAIQAAGGVSIPPLGLAWIVLGSVALERNDLEAAEQLLRDGIALARQGGLLEDVVLGLSHLGRLHAGQGNAAGAFSLLQEADAILQTFGIARMSALSAANLARLQVFTRQKQAAVQWASAYQTSRAEFTQEFADLALARVLLATGQFDPIPAILHPLLETANAAGRVQTSMEAMLLLALLHNARRETRPALDWLGKSLRLAAPEGFTRIFLDEGEPLLNLLPKARSAAPELVDTLLGMSRPGGADSLSLNQQLIEPLSGQELRVLRLIVAGKSNQEIAAELVISIGTAKWHVHNVLQKLGVSNRPQAITRARELGL